MVTLCGHAVWSRCVVTLCGHAVWSRCVVTLYGHTDSVSAEIRIMMSERGTIMDDRQNTTTRADPAGNPAAGRTGSAETENIRPGTRSGRRSGSGPARPSDASGTSGSGPDAGIFRLISDSFIAFAHRPFPIIPAVLESLSVACVTLAFLFAFANFSVFSFFDTFRDVTLRSMLSFDFLVLTARFIIDNIVALSCLIVCYMTVRLFMSSIFFSGMIRSCLDIYRGEKDGRTGFSLIGCLFASPVRVFTFRLMRFLLIGISFILLIPAIYIIGYRELSVLNAFLTLVLIILPVPIILIWYLIIDYNLYLGSYAIVIDGAFPTTAAFRSRAVMKKHFLKYTTFYLISKILSVGFFLISFTGSAAGLSFLVTLISVFLVRPYFAFLLVRFYGGSSEKENVRQIFRAGNGS